jgi:cell division protein FtsB
MLFKTTSRKVQKLLNRVADLEAEIEARDRQIRVLEAERDSMAAVIARDRERVRAETAVFAREQGAG